LKVIFLDEVDSTNEYLKRVPFEPGLAVVARRQTSGKGRRGKQWMSQEGKGLYFSIMFPPLKKNLTLAGLAFGYGVLRSLLPFSGSFYLKWPNDIYLKGKKVAGVLPELLKERLIVGVGINLYYSREELSHLPTPATSLAAEGVEFDYHLLLSSLYHNLSCLYSDLTEGRFSVREFERYCPLIGSQVRVLEEGKVYNARALGIDREGALIVEGDFGLKRLFSGEVSVREVR
jgi:BirA family biotin operon repressor/biotin-[acetyl-CoA-carboxylase] ligase